MNKQEPIKIWIWIYIYNIFLCYHNHPLKIYVQNENQKQILPFLVTWDYYVYVCVCEQKILIRFSPNSLQTIYES